jgi:hypothetical protein
MMITATVAEFGANGLMHAAEEIDEEQHGIDIEGSDTALVMSSYAEPAPDSQVPGHFFYCWRIGVTSSAFLCRCVGATK